MYIKTIKSTRLTKIYTYYNARMLQDIVLPNSHYCTHWHQQRQYLRMRWEELPRMLGPSFDVFQPKLLNFQK